MKILLVEDSPTLRHAMSAYIKDAGHSVILADDGEQAIQQLEHEQVDLIIMDVEMPGLNGFETTRLIREHENDQWTPIIFVTGKSDEDSFAEGIEAGGDDYLIKPVSAVILKAKIKAFERITQMRNQLTALNEDLTNLSQIDGLTNIYNRRTFLELSRNQWLQSARNKSPVALLMLDIDHFKFYNDHYGHPAGDSCIQKVTQAIKDSLQRPVDILGRYGGEEFVIFLPDTDRAGAEVVAEKIRASVEALQLPHQHSGTSDVVTVSVGGASCSHTTGRNIEQLIKHADETLYRCKHEGRNRAMTDHYPPQKSVLIVDDDPECLAQISEQLKEHCSLLIAHSGEECLDITHNIFPDVILLDIHMPGMEGTDVCQQLKQHPATATIPVILMSTEDRKQQVALGKQAGANDCLQKPLNSHLLLAKVNHYLT